MPNIEILSGLKAIADRYDAFLVDLWGVLHNGKAAFPNAVTALEQLKSLNKTVILLSNAPRRIKDSENRLAELGIPHALYNGIMTSGEETWAHLHERPDDWYQSLGEKTYYIGPDRHLDLMVGTSCVRVDSLKEANFILNTGIDEWDRTIMDYEGLLREALKYSLPMVCANPDKVVVYGEDLAICSGAIANAYEIMGGFVRYHGKPYQETYQRALSLIPDVERSRILAIGDSLSTDILGANRARIDSALITSGIHKKDLDSNAHQLKILLEIHKSIPNFSLSTLHW